MSKSTKKHYHQVFRETYSLSFPCILKSRKGDKFSFCTVCSCDINIAHGGKNDLTNHVKCAKHLGNLKSKEENQKINSFFANAEGNVYDVIKAECLFTSFLVEHNIPLSAADHAGALFRKMFPSSEIAKKYGCGRTKTTCVLNEMARTATQDIVTCLQNSPFSLSTDGSNDTDSKLYPIVVNFYDAARESIISTVLSVPALEGDSTGRNIGKLLLSQLELNKVPIKNCLAFCSDNAPVMIGQKNGVLAVLKEAHQDIFGIGCSCHLINLAAEKAAATLPVRIDEILVDIFYYLEKSAKRKERLQKFQSMHGKETKKLLKHVCTRWLSLARCLDRLLDQWDPLLSFFKDEVVVCAPNISANLSFFTIPKGHSRSDDKQMKRVCDPPSSSSSSSSSSSAKRMACSTKRDSPVLRNVNPTTSREEKLFMFLSSDLNKAFCTFLHVTIPSFDKINTVLQSASPHIHVLFELMMDLLKQMFTKFVKPSVVKRSALLDVQYHPIQNQKDDEELVIGIQTSNLVKVLQDEDKSLFFSSVRNYFCAACDYMVNKFPFKNDVLKHAQVAKLDAIEEAQFSSVNFFLEKFPVILCKRENETRDDAVNELQSQFAALQIDDLSSVVSNQAANDSKWASLLNVRGADGHYKYDRISRFMLSVLTISHSNAECERIFSLIKKNRTQFRSSMSNGTLEAISILKTRSSEACYTNTYSIDFLKKAKQATASAVKSE